MTNSITTMDVKPDSRSSVSVANGTIDREAYPKSWYAAHVQMKCEKKSASKLRALGYETFLPVQEEIHQWSDRRKKIEKVIIPLIVFFKCHMSELSEIEHLSFIFSLVKYPGSKSAAVIPNNQIEQLKFMLGQSESAVALEPLQVRKGAHVRVVRGKLRGLDGYILTDNRNRSRICITIENLACASVQVSIEDCELIPDDV